MTTRTEVFRLEPFSFDNPESSVVPDLASISPYLALPSLNDNDSSDRLLTALRAGPKISRRPNDNFDRKGKSKEVVVESSSQGHAGHVEDDREFWLNVAESEPGPSKPRPNKPKTWDALQDPLNDKKDPVYMSEASIFAFEAMITSESVPVNIHDLKTPVVTRARSTLEILNLVMQATLGNVTTGGIKWNAKEYRFVWTNQGGRAIGVEDRTTSSTIRDFLEISTYLRRLELTVDSLTPRPMTPTHHSLLHALSTCLTYIKQCLKTSIEGCSKEDKVAWHKWSSSLKSIQALLSVLCDVIQWPLSQTKPTPLPSRATAVLTHLHAHLLARLTTSSTHQTHSEPLLALAYLLKTASQPLLALLHEWVGLSDRSSADEDIEIEAQPWSDLGITRHTMPVNPNQEPTWEYTFSSSKMPGFIPKADRRRLFEAGRSLRLLREASGGRHPLCGGGWELTGTWGWGEQDDDTGHLRLHSRRVKKEIEQWQKSSRGLPKSLTNSFSTTRLRQPRRHRKSLPMEFRSPRRESTTKEDTHYPLAEENSPVSENKPYDPIWSMVYQIPGTHLTQGKTNSLWSPRPLSELEHLIDWHRDTSRPLLPEDTPTLSQHITSHLLAPLLNHSGLVSSALVSLYLDSLDFIQHLDVLHAYWLGGDVSFLERVNGALFGKDAAGAGEALGMGKRARTRARLGLGRDDLDNEKGEEQREWGIGLGIGLSERTKWPPGGAELTYALRTAIVDDDQETVGHGEVWEGIEDKVSYAIQDLPEDQKDGRRAKWLNPQAIEALDFLYLAYSAPPTIAVLLPRNLMEKYQSVHNLLLRIGRVETVLRSMFVDVHHQHDIFDEPVKSGVDARDRLQSKNTRFVTRETRRRSGIFPVGSRDEKRLWHLRYRMSHFVTTFSRYILDTAIRGNWQVLRKRLLKLQKRTLESSRPESSISTRPDEDPEDHFAFDGLDLADDLEDEDGESSESSQSIHQLHSIHSLVLYHHLIMDRVMRSCLLHPGSGYSVTFKILTTLFTLILDSAKTVKEVEKGLLGWEDGAERLETYRTEWVEKETVFLHSVERLSKRTPSQQVQDQGEAKGVDGDHDLEMLLQGERDGGEGVERDGLVLGRQGADLQELVLRIRLSS